jgi:FMN phosphatase YigB (HAD superfamily)
MSIEGIKHVWFDFTDTIAAMDREVFEQIVYGAYSGVVKRPVDAALVTEYQALLKEKKSNAAVFASLGLPAGYLSDCVNDRAELYHLTDPEVPRVIETLHKKLPLSIFSNTRLETTLPSLGIKLEWLTHILGPDRIKNPKPALDGFRMMVELSGVVPEGILFIGDDVQKDLMPAKDLDIKTGLLWKESVEADYCFEDFSEILRRLS